MENNMQPLSQQNCQESSEDEKQRQKALGFMKQISYSLHANLRAKSESMQMCNEPRNNIKQDNSDLFELIDSVSLNPCDYGTASEFLDLDIIGTNNPYPTSYPYQTGIQQQTQAVPNSTNDNISQNQCESLLPEIVDFILEMERTAPVPKLNLVPEQEQIKQIHFDLINNVYEMQWQNGVSPVLYKPYQQTSNFVGKAKRQARNRYHCPTCGVWYGTAGLLKRHFQSQSHNNRVQFEGGADPYTMAMWNFNYSRSNVHPY